MAHIPRAMGLFLRVCVCLMAVFVVISPNRGEYVRETGVVELLRRLAPCSVAKIPLLSTKSFRKDYRGKNPVVYSRNHAETSRFRSLADRNVLLDNYGAIEVTLASSNSFSAGKKEATLREYVQDHMPAVRQLSDLANESWYLFGDTRGPDWKRLEKQYEPPLDAASSDPAVAFGLGGHGSGVSFHTHGPAHAETVRGSKLWFLAPPSKRPRFHADETSLHWAHSLLTGNLSARCPGMLCRDAIAAALVTAEVQTCRVDEGFAIYIPAHWWHATLNLDEWTAFVSTFTHEME
jgi:hypothetical protein